MSVGTGRLGLVIAVTTLIAYILLSTYYFLVLKDKFSKNGNSVEDLSDAEILEIRSLIKNQI